MLVFCGVCALSGCYSMQNAENFGQSSLAPSPSDRGDEFADVNRVDKEHEEMMLQSRKGMAKSNEVDKWWSDWIMSPEARSIERSLGVQYQ